jgi:hypothetical protein
MKVDIFKRQESSGEFSYLAVPEGKLIPNEATNVDWIADRRNIDLEESNKALLALLAEDALEQISAKGYAITSLTNLHDREASARR